ncbi:transporter [Rhodococcus sp. D2-41]|uniref:Ketosteroid isomerase family protein n=1 Tax=Speluncibacter jeojiensis TaxID=2710754 RepID=A0A9X4REN8_9ACTN|nr:nuclear transport factor 2 family protein [Rhodococcus sp. D2-41]MDG3012767.1 transporter [Rhodococcus sp. D2-41]MDG3015442.1 ketosteroid isomerase family protein [Corynebacteriales bacterium D3-21]
MAKQPTAAEALQTVEASPAAVAVHDRSAWLDLMARGGVVNDPVGSRPHQGREAIGRFYDTFIAPNTIVFDVDHDVVCGSTVFRDLTIVTTMSTGVTLNVPTHLRYDLVEEEGALKVALLAAHWELPTMIVQLARAGVPGLAAALKLTPQMLSNQGVGGVVGFMKGLRRVGAAGKRTAAGFAAAGRRGDTAAVRAVLTSDARLECPAGTAVSVDEFVEQARGLDWTKFVAAGRSVTATVHTGDRAGVALLEFVGHRIERARLYLPQA